MEDWSSPSSQWASDLELELQVARQMNAVIMDDNNKLTEKVSELLNENARLEILIGELLERMTIQSRFIEVTMNTRTVIYESEREIRVEIIEEEESSSIIK